MAEQYQTIKIWLRSYYKLKMLMAKLQHKSMAETFDKIIEHYAKAVGVKLK